MRATEEHRDAEALRGAQHDVRAQLARCFQQKKGERVGDDGDNRTAGVQLLDDAAWVKDVALGAGVRNDGADEVFAHEALADIEDFHLELDGASALRRHSEHLRMQAGVQDDAAALLDRAGHQADCLSGSGSLVEQGSVCNRQTGKGFDHGLEVQQCFQAALGDLRLVRGISGVPTSILQQAAADDGRGKCVGVALAIEGLQHDVLAGVFAQLVLRFILAQGIWQLRCRCGADGCGKCGVDKRVHAVVSQCVEHRRLLGRIWSEVARDEIHKFNLL